MSTFTFPYDVQVRPDGRRRFCPMAEVYVQGTDGGWGAFDFHIDAGADITLMPASSAADLGIKATDGDFAVMQGIGGGLVDVSTHHVQMRIGTKAFTCRVAFATTDDVSLVLGRADVFTTFKVCYDDVNQLTEFHTRPRRRATKQVR